VEGIEYINKHVDANIWTVDVDNELNQHAYIVPGLGDAGDLSYGVKV
jgi:uracil phosphoribosyltransferase